MVLNNKSTQNKFKKKKNIVSFDEEIVTKDSAEKLLLNRGVTHSGLLTDTKSQGISLENKIHENSKQKDSSKSPKNINRKDQKRKGQKRQNQKSAEPDKVEDLDTDLRSDGVKPPKKVKKKKTDVDNVKETPDEEKNEDIELDKAVIKQEESIRAQKRKKHAKLLEEKRLKTLLSNQQNALSYLSLWKHNRNEWKFEKLKQIWLQQNLLDPSKIPNEFWDASIEYFCGSKGSIRKTILKSALEVIEKEENSQERSTEENYLLILQRARDIVQNLQE